ncbi:transmembrane protease serine 9-like [Drosophila kikkawai]|uniref:Transmembrane protease serine 9-like n=1 Tax=Drosophila kikkawai TaxID=30033 RepID=A0ABM4GB67_DROKI
MKIIGVLSILLSCAILGYGTNSVSLLEPNCGISISSSRNGTLRIIGGKIADMYGNPWMAYISSSLGACGGSLITNRFVLSAAHCISEPPAPTTVYLGQFDMSRSTPNGIQVPVDAQIRHPHYSKPKGFKNDIALFRLARTVQYTDFIRPICLPTNFSPLDQTTHLTTTGWGKTEYGVPSSVLKTTTLTQYDRWACSSRYHSNVDTSQICAGSPSSSSCNGDSGGPITTVYPINGRNRVIQLGTVSYGDIYCQSLGVYTNVIHYMAWIGTTIQQGGDQHTPAPTQSPSHSLKTYKIYCVAIALLSQSFNMKIIGVLSILLFCAILGYGKKSVSFLEPNCGLSISSGKATARIVGGEIADMYGNPWMAYIRHDSWCGGSLITNRFVLSAAHCITGYPATVYLGQFDMSRSTPNGIQVPVDAQIRHPHYSKPRGYKNDIALFQLARTVQYTDFIRPICLPTNFSPLDQTTHLTTTGWGKTENGVPSSVLKTTTLTQYDRRACSSRYNSNVDISQICAGSPSSSSCNGDSGGPITTVYPINGTDRVIQLGILDHELRSESTSTNSEAE